MNATVKLGCPTCKGEFHLPVNWWYHRLMAGLPRMECRGCNPANYP